MLDFSVEDVIKKRYSVRTYDRRPVEKKGKGKDSSLCRTSAKSTGTENEKNSLEALGYDFEQLVLYATSLGLGTCWLGGTFNRSAFASVMEIGEQEIFPILSPLGYPAQKKSFTEQIMRRTIKADNRLDWKELFYKDNFQSPLPVNEAGSYKSPLEMLRLAPSAVNKQPWRVVVSENTIHFFEKHSMSSEKASIDMQRIDVGIAICHFHLAE